MNPLVSVIIPTKNSEKTLEACLVSIKNQSYSNVEIFTVDNNSTDKTKEIAAKYGNVLNKGPERSAQRNFGVANSKGKYVLIIDSDMVLSKDVVKACVEKAESDSSIKGIVIPEESFGEGFWAQCKKLEKSFYVGVDWIEAARFFTREVFDQMHGYDEEITGPEDIDLPQRVQAKYGKQSINRVQVFIYHNEQRISLIKTCQKKYYYAKKLKKYMSIAANIDNFQKQSSILSRFVLYFSQPRKLYSHPIRAIGLLVMKLGEFSGGLVGYLLVKVNKK